MFNRHIDNYQVIFNYILKNITAIKRISITNNIITFYGHDLHSKKNPDHLLPYLSFSLSKKAKEACKELIIRITKNLDSWHNSYHHNDVDRSLVHQHHFQCDVITPQQLTSMMSEIVSLQNNETAKRLYHLNAVFENGLKQEAAIKMNKPDLAPPEVKLDYAKMNYITENDIKQITTEYRRFYIKNENEMKAQYKAYKREFNLEDQSLELGKNLLNAFTHAIILMVMEEMLVKSGMTRKNAQRMTLGLQILLIAMTSESLPVFLAMGAMLLIMENFKLNAVNIQAFQSFIAVISAAWNWKYISGKDILNAAAYASGATVSNFLARKTSQRLFQTPEQREITESSPQVSREGSRLQLTHQHS